MVEESDAGTGRAAAPRRPGRPRREAPSEEYLERLATIVDSAAELFQQNGYDATSLGQLADELDLRKASLYHYIDSKADLLRMVFERTLQLALERFEEIQAMADPRARIAALVEHQVLSVTTYPSYFAVFFDQGGHLARPHADRMREQQRHYLAVYADAVREASAHGVLPMVDPDTAAQAILGMTNWTYKWYRPEHHHPGDIAATFVTLLLGDAPRAEALLAEAAGVDVSRGTS